MVFDLVKSDILNGLISLDFKDEMEDSNGILKLQG